MMWIVMKYASHKPNLRVRDRVRELEREREQDGRELH